MTDWDATVAVPANELAMTGGGYSAASTATRTPVATCLGLRVCWNPTARSRAHGHRTFRLDEVNEALDAVASKDVATAILAPTA